MKYIEEVKYLREYVKIEDLVSDRVNPKQFKKKYHERLLDNTSKTFWPANGLVVLIAESSFNIKKEYQAFFNRTREDQLEHLQMECIHVLTLMIEGQHKLYISEYLICAGFTVFVFQNENGDSIVLNHIQFDEFLAGKLDVFDAAILD